MPRAISKATWDQIKIARAAGASYGELAERTGISKGTILAHAHRNGWTKDIALARPKADASSLASFFSFWFAAQACSLQAGRSLFESVPLGVSTMRSIVPAKNYFL